MLENKSQKESENQNLRKHSIFTLNISSASIWIFLWWTLVVLPTKRYDRCISIKGTFHVNMQYWCNGNSYGKHLKCLAIEEFINNFPFDLTVLVWHWLHHINFWRIKINFWSNLRRRSCSQELLVIKVSGIWIDNLTRLCLIENGSYLRFLSLNCS